MCLPDLPMLHLPPVVLPRVSHLPPQSLMSINKSGVPLTLSASSSAPLSAGPGSMSHLSTTLLWKQWASPGLQSKQLAYSDVQQWHSHRLCYDVRQHHNISCRRTELNIIDFFPHGQWDSLCCILYIRISVVNTLTAITIYFIKKMQSFLII